MTQNSFFLPNCPDPTLHANAQGIARVAVDDEAKQLIVTFERQIPPSPPTNYLLDPRSYSLTGGERLFPHIVTATRYNPTGTPPDLQDRRVLLQLDSVGDFSIYTLTVNGPDIDPFFSSHKLRFRLACDDHFDCRELPPEPLPEPELPVAIDYLAKDYASFRQALLDFIPTRLPAWTERSEADIGIMLLELFATTADTLSYMQDRVANEAFLNSATQRRSVAEHLALIGYELDEGASAYTWLQFQVNSGQLVSLPSGFRVSTNPLHESDLVIVFETYALATFYQEHNGMEIYTWDNQNCCLPRTSLSVTLIGKYEHLRAGDYILIKDTSGHADVVRLTANPEIIPPDPTNPIKAHPTESLTVLRWLPSTPLHYDYCIQDEQDKNKKTTVHGNLVLATHGETTADPTAKISGEIKKRPSGQCFPRQRLRLQRAPLAHIDTSTDALVAPLDQKPSSAEIAKPPAARSKSTLKVTVNGEDWNELPSLLDSGPTDPVYRVEIDDEGYATIVFGDGIFGQCPPEMADVTATYRIGSGAVGNLAADTLVRLQMGDNPIPPWFISVTNPLPATGGRDLESRDHARRFAPTTFQNLLVAVTEADYRAVAQDFTDAHGQKPIQRANASFRWTGSWLTVTLAVDPRGTQGLSVELRNALLAFLDTRRLAGYDLEVRRAIYVPIDLVIEFCPAKGFFAPDVQKRLLQALSNGDLPGGRKGFFHPDNFSFGDNLYVSQLYAAIMAVAGVESAQITQLTRARAARPAIQTAANLRQGYLSIGLDEIIQLDNDRNFPQRGTLTIRPKGGR